MGTPRYLKVITIINVLVATVFSIAGMINHAWLIPPGTPGEKAITIFALYAGARTIPIAGAAIILINSKRDAFFSFAFLAGLIQFLDGFIGIYQQDIGKTAGPFFLAILQLVAVYFALKKVNSN